MANTLGFYDPYFYANESLLALKKALGLASTVYRGYDSSPQQKGSVINIKAPAEFQATDVNTNTGGTTQDVDTKEVQIKLDQWKEVKFALTDKELTYTKEQIITDHIQPAAYAIADKIDQDLATLVKNIPWYARWSNTTAVADITNARKILFNNKVPVANGQPLFFMLDGDREADLLAMDAFSQYQGAGATGEATQVSGYLGKRYGMTFFANQNAPSFTDGAITDLAGALSASAEKGAESIAVSGLTSGDAFKAGDVFTITGDAQKYVVASDVTTIGTTATFSIYPALKQAASSAAVVTFEQPAGASATKTQCFAFHRNCIALAMAPLSDIGAKLGAQIATVTDEVTGLAIRSRLWYDGDKSSVKVGLDALWGKQILNPNMGVRIL